MKRQRRFNRVASVRPVRCSDLQPIRDLFVSNLSTVGANDANYFSCAGSVEGYKSCQVNRRHAEVIQ